MNKSMMETEALLFWKISRDTNRPGLSQHERQEFSDEMEGFAMNAQNSRVRHLAAASLEALAKNIRSGVEVDDPLDGEFSCEDLSTNGLSCSSVSLGDNKERYRFVAPISFTRHVCLQLLDLLRTELETSNGQQLSQPGFELSIRSLRQGWDEIGFVASTKFTRPIQREFGKLLEEEAAAREAKGRAKA